MFLTHQYNPRGKYRIKIYDPITKENKIIEIDDWIPCHKSNKSPVFTHPRGKEGWVVLLEKMFAKYQRSYHNIEGNIMLYALVVLTGCNGNTFLRTSQGWQTYNLVVKAARDPARDRDEVNLVPDPQDTRYEEDMFNLMVRLLSKKCMVTAGTKGRDNTIGAGRGSSEAGGIVPGHAYSILKAIKPSMTGETIRLVKLRNPWGSFEWKGAWSDNSPEWKKYPLVKAEVWPNIKDNDGCFWMDWKDFVKHYDQLDVIYTGAFGLDGVCIDVKENFGPLGPCCGFAFGIIKYWALCFGFYKLWCVPQERKGRTLEDIEAGVLERMLHNVSGERSGK